MSTNDRDTKFRQGFAKLLYDDFLQLREADESSINEILTDDYIDKWRDKVETLIAQRAYDLACHVLESEALQNEFLACVDGNSDLEKNTDLLQEIPDITEWPTPPASAPASPAPD